MAVLEMMKLLRRITLSGLNFNSSLIAWLMRFISVRLLFPALLTVKQKTFVSGARFLYTSLPIANARGGSLARKRRTKPPKWQCTDK
jgi:hypothetical protein